MAKKYSEYLVGGEVKIEEALLPHKVMQAQKTCELEIARQEEIVATLKVTLEREKARYPLSLANVINSANQLAIAEKNLATAKAVHAELF